VINDAASGGIIIAGSILSSRALAPVEAAIANWRSFVATRQAWARLETLLARIPADRSVMSLPAPKENIVVESLAAAPPGGQRLTVGDVTFKLEAGDVLGVIGPSGSGKTSLLRALVGVWQPVRGSVRLDGATMDQWAVDEIGRHIGFMPQDVELFDGTVAQNIARFDPDASDEDILAAAKAADVHDLIVRLPQGYDSPLGTYGSNLSAGQRQRIALARALYRDPFLIVLDEPNSNLDGEGEAALAKAIAGAAARGAIVILVAHRPSALAGANRILYMAEGRMRLFGPREEVLAKLAVRPAVTAAPVPAGDNVQHLPKAV
jgi:PrtD family type I secretion system ABC transporter